MAIGRAAGTADDTLDATSATLVDDLTLTPASGDYFLYATVGYTVATGADETRFEVYVGGSVVTASRRIYKEDTSVGPAEFCVALSCKVSLNGSQAVEIRHHSSPTASGSIAKKRELNLFPISGTDVENTGTVDDTLTAGNTFVAVDDMTMTTPASGNYLLSFTSSYLTGGNTADIELVVTVAGVELAHTLRSDQGENSDSAATRPLVLVCHVSVDGTEDVVIKWRRATGAGSFTMYERTMNLIPTASGDIFEASGTVDDADTTTDDKLIDDLTITDPGADDYLTIFNSYDNAPAITVTYSMHEGGALVTDSERPHQIDGSIASVDRLIVAGGRVTVGGATDDIEIFWQGTSTSSRLVGHRTLVALREATAGAAEEFLGRQYPQGVMRGVMRGVA